MSSRPLFAQAQPFFPIQPVHPLVVHGPSFAPQKNVNPIVAVLNLCLGDLSNLHPQGGLIVLRRFILVRRSEKLEHVTTSLSAGLGSIAPLFTPLSGFRVILFSLCFKATASRESLEFPGEIAEWWRARSRTQLIPAAGGWRSEGPQKRAHPPRPGRAGLSCVSRRL